MSKPQVKRPRDKDVEDCGKCGAAMWLPCVDKKGRHKAPCVLRDLCVRCMAQTALCRCGKEGENPETGWIYDDRKEYKQADLFNVEGLTAKGGGL